MSKEPKNPATPDPRLAADDKPRAGVNQFMHSPAIFTPFGHPTNFTPPHHPSPAQVLKTRDALIEQLLDLSDTLGEVEATEVVDHLIRNEYLSERAYRELGDDFAEAVINFSVGGPAVTAEQMEQVAEIGRKIGVVARGPIV